MTILSKSSYTSPKHKTAWIADKPAASASPLTFELPHELDEIDAVFVSRKALAAGNVADRPAAERLAAQF